MLVSLRMHVAATLWTVYVSVFLGIQIYKQAMLAKTGFKTPCNESSHVPDLTVAILGFLSV